MTRAAKSYRQFAADTRAKSAPDKPGTPSGCREVRSGFGRFSPTRWMHRALLDVPHGGAMKAPRASGSANHVKTSSCEASSVKSIFAIVAKGHFGINFSMATPAPKPTLQSAAETPPVPAKISMTQSSSMHTLLKVTSPMACRPCAPRKTHAPCCNPPLHRCACLCGRRLLPVRAGTR